jgi:hypothetical protein
MILDLFHSYHFTFEEVRPDGPEIRFLLKTEDTDENHPLNISIREIMLKMENNRDISGGYMIRKTKETPLNTGSQIKKYMRDATYLALFVCTAGGAFSDLTEQYNKNDAYLEAFVTDVIGSLTVEHAMNKIQAQLESTMNEENLHITNRYSPGYCNWPVSGQQELFGYMGNLPVNITLKESCLMLPIKSVSGIIGIGENAQKQEYACHICNNKICFYRKNLNHIDHETDI